MVYSNKQIQEIKRQLGRINIKKIEKIIENLEDYSEYDKLNKNEIELLKQCKNIVSKSKSKTVGIYGESEYNWNRRSATMTDREKEIEILSNCGKLKRSF